MSKRIDYLDTAKGVSLLAVMITHSCGMPFEKYFVAFYIQIFFILSGITYKEGRSLSENIARRFKRIIKPYFIYSFVIIAINIILGELKTGKELLEALIGVMYSRYCFYPIDYAGENKFFLLIGNSPLWFLTAMLMSSCVFYITIKYAEKKVYVVSVIFMILTALLCQLPILLPWSIDTAFLGAFFMLAGYYGKKIFTKDVNFGVVFIVLVLYVIGCHYNGTINISIRRYGNYGAVSVLAVCIMGILGTFLCLYLSKIIKAIPIIGSLFNYIGRNTIMLLAMHMTCFNIFNDILDRIGISEDRNGFVYYGVGFVRLAATIGVCFMVQYILKSLWMKKDVHVEK